MTLRRRAIAQYGPGIVEAVIPPPCPPCSVLHSVPYGHWAPMPSADCCSALRADSSSPPSLAVARHFPGHRADLPGEDREWSLPKRDMYPLPWFTGLCCVVPARPRDVGLLCRSCSSPRSAVASFLQTPPRGDALALDLSLSSCILRLMKVNLRQGTCTPTLTPMPGVHNTLERDARYARAPPGAALGVVRKGTS